MQCKITDRSSSVKNFRRLNRASSILRDVFNDTFTSIQIDDEELYNQTKDYLQEIAPSKQSIVKFYQSDTPILKYNIETDQDFIWKTVPW
jgi:Ribonuclease G/E